MCLCVENGPENGIHGWIYLDENGLPCPAFSPSTNDLDFLNGPKNENRPLPRVQILIIDGRFCLDLVPDMLLPQFQPPSPFSVAAVASSSYYDYCCAYMTFVMLSMYNAVRPFLYSILHSLCQWRAVRWLSQYVFGALICLVRPHSTGSVTMVDPPSTALPVTTATAVTADSVHTLASTVTSNIEIDLGHFSDKKDFNLIQRSKCYL